MNLIFSFAGLAVAISSAALGAFIRLSIQLARIEGKVDLMREMAHDHEERLRILEPLYRGGRS